MDPSEAIKIFLSYARKDGSDLARRLHDDLKARGFAPWLDKHRIAGGASWTDEIEQALDAAAFFLAVMKRGSYESEICRAEQLRALRKGKLAIPLLGQSDPDVVPLYFETRNYRDLSANYAAAFSELLEDIANGRSPSKLAAKYRSTPYNTVPPLPLNYVERASELRALRDALITDGEGRHIALTALRGMGGIGKSILAQALCHDPVVQQAFPDGIVWLTIGRESTTDILTQLREAAKALGDDLAHYENQTAAQNRFRSIQRDQAVLIVLDDVWDAHAVEPFSADSPRSRLLITTRDASIAAGTGATEHIADLLSEADARSVLSKWSGVAVENQPLDAAALIQETGRLPLALAMIGAMLRGKPEKYWARVVALLQQADLEKIRAQFPDYPHHDLFRAMEVGVAALDETTRARYLRLAVTLEDMVIEPAVQRTLWNCSEGEALDTAETLVRLSLAERVREDGAIRLHDLQLDYLRGRWPDRGALQLIRGALRLSMHVVAEDPTQFASQMVGRLLVHRDKPGVAKFVGEITVAAPRPWFRPLHPCFDSSGGALLRTLEGHSRPVRGVAVTPDGKRAVSASFDNTLKVWDLETGRALRTLEGHSASVLGAAVTPDGKRAVSVSDDKTLKVSDLDTGRALRTLEGHSDSVSGVAVSADGKRAVSASQDQTLKVWDLETGSVLRTLEGHSSGVNGVAVTPDGKGAVSVSTDNTLKVWDLETGLALRTLEGHSSHAFGVAMTPDGKRVVSASPDNTLKVWDLETGRALRTLEGHSSWVLGVAVTPDGRRAVSASGDATLKVWDLETGRGLRTLEGHSDSVRGAAVTPDGKRAVSASDDSTLKVWDLEMGRALWTLQGHSRDVRCVALTRDGKLAVSASWDHTLKVWDLETGRALRTLEGYFSSVNGLAMTPDGKGAVSASSDNTLTVWDLDTGRALRTLEGHSSYAYGVAVTPDGKRVVSASDDATLKVWDLETGRTMHTLEGHSDSVGGVAVTADGKRAVSASWDKTLKMWDLETVLLIGTFRCESHALCCACADERRMAVGDYGGRVYFLALEE